MSQKRRPIFREHALQQYMERQEEDVLPHFVSPPAFIIIWLLFVLIIVAGLISWMQRVPTYVNGVGVVFANDQRMDSHENAFDALIFVPASQSQQLHSGLRGLVAVGPSGQYASSQIISITPQVFTPNAAQSQYKLGCNVAQNLTAPSVAVRMRVFIPANSHVQSGTTLQARVQTGTQRVLSLFPPFQSLTGGS